MSEEKKGWYGVDLDRTLAHYDKWKGELHIGDPVGPMVDVVKQHLANGDIVKIFTARVAEDHVGVREEIAERIAQWTEEIFGVRLEVTNVKDYAMIALYDDRAIQIIPNTGISVQSVVLAMEEELERVTDELSQLQKQYNDLLLKLSE